MEDTRILMLVRRARAGDREAFAALAREFEPVVFGLVLRRLRNRSEAREATQEVFLRVWRKLPQLRAPERFAGWLRRIAIREAVNRATRRPKETLCAAEPLGTVTDGEAAAPLQGMLRAERAERVRHGLQRLPATDRETLLAFYFQGRSLKEMSAAAGSPVGTIKRRLHVARGRLRRELANLDVETPGA